MSLPLLSMLCCCKDWCKNEYAFGAAILRYAFAIMFILVAVKKFRMGYTGFADSLVSGDTLIAQEIPSIILYIYGLLLPAAELIAGILLLINKYVKEAYVLIAWMYLTFVFGQQYNGNTAKVGTEYLPSLVALSVAFFFSTRSK